ncbi:uncharacterized protein HMPREF1541_01568 [Cyphellophora europaea CBS 101466]|uniref:Fungal N-terminal domain-containing protein n=1 Tax=Cyphellophora europaea (strain CBS 101466) TaxID=1220924 RepID=W2S3B1_CYPE1|nr:uncharacterized protein HMPREF1541_01568 [Cyphellophora europaea CBS 101466]ETN42414.1 hypothetical protein HMPREF1541_01568 [Cyphellophora europaea CBS 101466]
MEEIVAVSIAFPQLIKMIYQTAKSLRRCAKAVSVAQERVSRLADETNLFAALFEDLRRTLTKAQQVEEYRTIQPDSESCELLLKQGRNAVKMMKQALNKLKPLRSDTPCSYLETALASLKWHFQADDFTEIFSSMNSAKASASVLIGLFQLEQVIQSCQKHAAAGRDVPRDLRDDIQRYRRQIKNFKEQVASLKQRCKDDRKLSKALRRNNAALLRRTAKLQREHEKKNRALRLVLESSRTLIDSNEFGARLVQASARTPPTSISTEPSSPPVSVSSTLSRTDGHLNSTANVEEQPHRERPLGAVPTPLFQVPERGVSQDSPPPPSPPREARSPTQALPQNIIVDRNDGTGVQEEYRPPRQTRRRLDSDSNA